MAVLGAILLFSGIDMARTADFKEDNKPILLLIIMAVLTLGYNPGVAFLVGLLLVWVQKSGWPMK